MIWARILGTAVIFGLIETADYYVEPFSSPWWASLLMAVFLPFSDIVFIIVLDVLTSD